MNKDITYCSNKACRYRACSRHLLRWERPKEHCSIANLEGTDCCENGEIRRQRMYDFIVEYIKVRGYSPTVREIGAGVGLQSTSTVHTHLQKMFDSGMLETDHLGVPRAIRVPGYKFVRMAREEA